MGASPTVSLTAPATGAPDHSRTFRDALWLRYVRALPADPATAVYRLEHMLPATSFAQVHDGAFPLGPGPDPPLPAAAAAAGRASPHHLLNVRRYANDTALPGLAVAPRWAPGPDAAGDADADNIRAVDRAAWLRFSAKVEVRVRWKEALGELFVEERLRQTLSRRWVRPTLLSFLSTLLFCPRPAMRVIAFKASSCGRPPLMCSTLRFLPCLRSFIPVSDPLVCISRYPTCLYLLSTPCTLPFVIVLPMSLNTRRLLTD